MKRLLRLSALILIVPLSMQAQVRLPNLLSDHGVLQRDQPVRIWGWALPKEKITVQFHEQKLVTEADERGDWETFLRPEAAGGPYTLTVSGDDGSGPIKRKDILMGDVWLASGQSNMEFPLKGFGSQAHLKDGEKEIAAANYPQIRLLRQRRVTAAMPVDDIADTWMECNSTNAADFSAVAYFFGRAIHQQEHVPIGLIDVTWGGTPAHSWMSMDALGSNNFTNPFAEVGQINRDQIRANKLIAIRGRGEAALRAQGKPVPYPPGVAGDHQGSWLPGVLFNGMIAPDTKFTIKGVIWYQGETDANPQRSRSYARLFRGLISDWRQQWGEGDFPFLFVQISSYHAAADWMIVRDAQRRALSLRNTAMVVSLDVGDAQNVHPSDKQTVGARLAKAALDMVYHDGVDGNSPEFVKSTSEAGGMRVWLRHAKGLTTKGQPLSGFEVAGADRVFRPATAAIETMADGDTVLASTPQVPLPRYVRYAWQDIVKTYLYNAEGLPLGSFTSEPE